MIAVSASFDKFNQISFPSYEKFLAKSNVMHHLCHDPKTKHGKTPEIFFDFQTSKHMLMLKKTMQCPRD